MNNPVKLKKMVSICLATYNHEKYVITCLQSIINQSYSNIELLISDDCSNDRTFKILSLFLRKKKIRFDIKIFNQKKRLGISKNYNFLYSKAKGDYIIFFGGDDIMLKDRIKKQISAFNKNPNSSFCYSNCIWFFEKEKLRFNHFNFFHRNPVKLENILSDYTIPSPTIMIKKKFLNKEPFDKRLMYYSDFLLVVQLWKKSPAIYINENLVLYRRHKNSALSLKIKNDERLSLIRLIKNEFKNNKKAIKKIEKYYYIYLYHEILKDIELKRIDIKKILFFCVNSLTNFRKISRVLIVIYNLLFKFK
jgi:glycosyltransferase involved in cell wall biosynthesis